MSFIAKKRASEWFIDLLFLSLTLLIFYALWLGSYPLFTPDEGRYPEVAREMLATYDFITPRVNGVAFLDKPVLYYWLQALAMFLFGVNEWAIRFFPAIFGILGCLLTYVSGRLLFNRRTALFAAFILASSPLYFGNAHYADLNLEVAIFITATLFFFLIAVQKENLRAYFLYAMYIVAACAFLTKGLIGIAFPALIISSWMILTWRFDLLKKLYLGRGIILFCALSLPWYVLVQKVNPGFFHYFFINQQVSRFLSAGVYNNKTPFWFYIPVMVMGFFPWIIFFSQMLYFSLRNIFQKTKHYQTELFLLLWMIIIFVFFSIPRSKTLGYILPVFPPLALLTGYYLDHALLQTKRNIWPALQFIIMNISLAFLLLWLPLYTSMPVAIGFIGNIKIIAALFFASSALALFTLNKFKYLFLLCLTTSILFLLTVIQGATYLSNNSVKPLALNISGLIKPEDEIVTYFKYYQDLPVYLKTRITIVADWHSPLIAQNDNWLRELWYGMPFQNTQAWLIDEKKFWQRWESKKRIFLFVNKNYFDQFKAAHQPYFEIGRYNDIILLSNQANIILSKNP